MREFNAIPEMNGFPTIESGCEMDELKRKKNAHPGRSSTLPKFNVTDEGEKLQVVEIEGEFACSECGHKYKTRANGTWTGAILLALSAKSSSVECLN